MLKQPIGEGVAIGPPITPAVVAKVREHIEDATAKGATIATGGAAHDPGGRFFQPTLISGATADMAVAREETFGPLAPVFRFSTTEEALAAANDTEFGLTSYFYSKDLSRVWQMMEGLEYGMVGVNTGLISTEVAPFGGLGGGRVDRLCLGTFGC